METRADVPLIFCAKIPVIYCGCIQVEHLRVSLRLFFHK